MSEVNASLASTELIPAATIETLRFPIMKMNPVHEHPVITVNLATVQHPAQKWILDTSGTNHVTGNHYHFMFFRPMPKGDHWIIATNNKVINAEGS
jgi:hypothetical protein